MAIAKEPDARTLKPVEEWGQPTLKAKEEWEKRVYAAMNRTPEQLAAARQLAEEHVIPGRPLPLGKTLEDVFVGAIQDDMTEEEFIRAVQDI